MVDGEIPQRMKKIITLREGKKIIVREKLGDRSRYGEFANKRVRKNSIDNEKKNQVRKINV